MQEETFKKKVLPLFTLSIVLTFISSFIGLQMPAIFMNFAVFIGLAIASIAAVVILVIKPNLPLLVIFNVIEGFLLTGLMYIANSVDVMIIPEAFGITSVIFVAFSIFSYKTKYSFLSWGTGLFILLIVAIVLTIMQIFIQSPIFNTMVDLGVIVLFIGFILYDVQKIMQKYPDNEYINASVALYLDFLNIFVRVVSILIRRKK